MFLALLPATDGAAAVEAAERLRLAAAAMDIDIGGRVLKVTVSFGVASVQHAHDLPAAIARADQALYASKRQGRNQVNQAAARYPRGMAASSLLV